MGERTCKTELLMCRGCSSMWPRPIQKGRKPTLCDDCRASKRWCRRCEQALPLAQFALANDTKSGMTGNCRGCRGVKLACRTCGAPVAKAERATKGHIYQWYCSPECRPTCPLDGCGTTSKYHTPFGHLCPVHYVRWKKHGDPHVVLLVKDLSAPPETCRQCAGPRGAGYHKWFCSARCCGRWYVGIDETEQWLCVGCPDGVVRRADSKKDAKLCRACRSMRPPLSGRQLAERDGPTCRICLVVVRLDLPARHTHQPAADHIVPRAKGGPNTAENLQLTHHRCNAVKQDRLDLDAATVARLATEAAAANTDPRRGATTCGAGHPRTAANGYWERQGWCCRECKYLRANARYRANHPVVQRRRGRRVVTP